MKCKKVISGVLAVSMMMTSVILTPFSAFAGTRSGNPAQISVSEIKHTAPAVGGKPKQVMAVIDQHHDQVEDRAENPVTMENADSNSADIQHLAGVWGFNHRLKSASGSDKLNVRGDAQMLVSFRMYLKGFAQEGAYCSIFSKGDQYGVQLTENGLRLYMQNEQGAVRDVTYPNCFAGGRNRWYDVVAVIDARNASKSRIYVDGQASGMMSHRNVKSTDDPFALACKVKDGAASETLTTDHGYLADVKFYNSRVLSSEDNETFRQSLNLDALDRIADDGWSEIQELIDSVKPTGNFSLKPYNMETVWKTSDGEPVENDFQCGYAYTATTVFKAHDGFSFAGNTNDTIQFTDGYEYQKIALTEDCGVAASEEQTGESGGAQGWGKFAVDGDVDTYWHTKWKGGNDVNLSAGINNTYTITLPEKKLIGKFEYLPRQPKGGATINGTILKYSLWYKGSAEDEWSALVTDGSWDSSTNRKSVEFDPVEAKEIQIRVSQATNGNFITAAEFEVFEAIPKSSVQGNVALSENDTIMTVTAQYGEVPCTAEIQRVAFASAATMEKGQTHQITSSVYASDGRLVSEHKGLLEASKNIVYTYQAKAEDGTSDTDVITVNETTGAVTAVKAGTATVKAEASLDGRKLGSRNIRITVLEQNKRLENPLVSYTSPVEGSYPKVAEAGVQRTDLANEMLVDVVEGGSTLSLIEGAEEPAFECINNITGFAARYKASAADQQFNVTGENPMVITLKLYLKQLVTDANEHTIVSKGNQYNLVAMKRNNKTVLRFQISGGSWAAWAYEIDESFLDKWHDIVIVADGKGNANSVGFFVDGTYCSNKIQGDGIPQISATDGSASHLREFAVCDKTEEANKQFTKEDGYLARVRFYNINQIDPLGQLAEKINLTALGTDNAAAIIQSLLDTKTPTAHITATPYSIETTWNVLNEKGEETPLDAATPFTNVDLLNNGYSVRTVFRTFGGFAFNSALDTSKVKEWLTISPKVAEELYECSAALRDGGRELEIRVAFLPARIPAQKFTYASPASDRTYRRHPRYDEDAVEKYMTVADTKWLTNGTTEITDPEATFAPITDSNWYRAESVLTAKNVYLFDSAETYLTGVKESIQTQVFGDVEAEKTVTVSDDGKTMTIWLDYKKPIYQVTFDPDGGTGSDLEPQSVSVNRTAKKPQKDPQKSGYKFDGWYVGDTDAKYNFNSPVTANVSLKAKWIPVYSVTFHPNQSGMEDIVRTAGEDGKVAAETLAPVEGVIFAGWFEKEANGSWKADAFNFDTVLAKNTDLYAKWNAKVTFKDSEEPDAETVKEVTVESGTAVAESEIPTPEGKTGYDFKNWYLKNDGEETEFTKDTVISEHTTVYAKWEPKTYNVTYELNGGNWGDYTAPVTIKHGESLSVTDEPVKDDAAFAGWYKDESLTERYDFAPAAGDIKIYAKWTDATVYTVTYDVNTENAHVTPTSVRIVENESITVEPQAVKEHWEVEGWYKDKAFTRKYVFGKDGTAVTESMTLYAKWQRKTYTVTFDADGGSAVASMTVESESTIQEAPVSTKKDCELEGWYQDTALTRKFVFGTDRVLRDMTLHARWIVPVSEITIEPSTVNMKVGENPVQLRANVLPANATDSAVTWVSENPAIASVSATGLVTAMGGGQTKIKASAGGKTAEADVTVEEDESSQKKRVLRAEQDFGIKSWASDRDTSYTNRQILVVRNEEYADENYGFTAEGMLVNGQAGNDSSISLLQFDLTGMTMREREALKTADLRLCLAGGKSASADNHLEVTVVPAESGLTDLNGKTSWNAVSEAVTDWLSSSENRFEHAGASGAYSDNGGKDMGKAAPLNPPVYVNTDITEAMKAALSDISIGKLILAINETKGVEQYFVRTSGAIGDNKFSGATDDMAPSILFTYEGEYATEVAVTPKTKTLTSAGEQVQLGAEVSPATALDRTVTWTSGNPEVATVDQNGLVTAVSSGKTTITATANGSEEGQEVKDTAEITVDLPCFCEIGELTVAGGTSIRIRASEESGSLQLSALAAVKGTCEIAGHPDNNEVTYTYEILPNAVNTAGASVDGTTGLVTATQAGETEITVNAALADGAENKTTVSKTVKITVTKLAEGFSAVEYHANTNGHDAEVEHMPEGLAVEDGTKLNQPAAPTWEGHTFKGWSVTPNGTVVQWPYEVTTDVDFYAIWEEAGGITDAQAKEALRKAIADAAEKYNGPDVYTDSTWNAFKHAYEAATGDIEGMTAAELKQLADDLIRAAKALVVDGDKLMTAIPEILADAKQEIEGGNTQYKADSWKSYADAYEALRKAVESEEEISREKLIELYQTMLDAKRNLKVDDVWAGAKEALNKALKQAAGILAGGGSKYDAAAWNAFKNAYNAALAKKDAKIADITAEALGKLTSDLNKAMSGLSATALKKGDYVDKNGVRYVVIDAAAKKVSAEGIASQKKKLKKVTIAATVSINGVTCTVTQIKEKAFSKFANLKNVTIAGDVEQIGKQAFQGCKKLKKITFKGKKAPVFKGKVFKGTPSNLKVKLSKSLKKGKAKKDITRKLRKAGVSKKAKIG